MADIPELPSERFFEVFAVDGGSTDGTADYLVSQGIPVHKQPIKSLNAAYHYAVELCRTEHLVLFFPKGSINPECVIEMANLLDGQTELVIASRNINGGKNEEDHKLFKPRKWGVTLLALFSAIIWCRQGPWIIDILHGVKGFSLEAFRRMSISKTGVTIDLEMAVRSYRLNIKRKEIPVIENSNGDGSTHFPILPTAIYLAEFLLRELWHSAFSSIKFFL